MTRKESIVGLLKLVSGPRYRRLGYEEVIGWFVDHRPAEGPAGRGAVLRKELPDGRTQVVLTFLGADGEFAPGPDGRPVLHRVLVDELDEELAEAFGDGELIIIN
jgi:hypothetical protein